ncbi:hypothetical protein CUC08_Gglean005974 [Alternaria sp. MG1]|nr:hypothetical protein CUC08_Gglean005974 [Alternaria sp. MG1]
MADSSIPRSTIETIEAYDPTRGNISEIIGNTDSTKSSVENFSNVIVAPDGGATPKLFEFQGARSFHPLDVLRVFSYDEEAEILVKSGDCESWIYLEVLRAVDTSLDVCNTE